MKSKISFSSSDLPIFRPNTRNTRNLAKLSPAISNKFSFALSLRANGVHCMWDGKELSRGVLGLRFISKLLLSIKGSPANKHNKRKRVAHAWCRQKLLQVS